MTMQQGHRHCHTRIGYKRDAPSIIAMLVETNDSKPTVVIDPKVLARHNTFPETKEPPWLPPLLLLLLPQ